ncbi:MAG: hypothetical protein K0S34_2127 [Bacillales bacterium]|nr:hypothetical protein [Bacillales bacterium]
MKKSNLILVILVVLVFINLGYSSNLNNDLTIYKMKQLFNENGIEVTEWNVLARTNAGDYKKKSDAIRNAELLCTKLSGQVCNTSISNQGIKLTSKVGNVNYLLSIHSNLNNWKVTLIATLNGKKWNKKTSKKEINNFLHNMERNFKQNVTIFSCIKGYSDDNIEEILQKRVKNIFEDLEAKVVEASTEEAFVSASAYTEVWEAASIQTAQGKMNCQIAVRQNCNYNGNANHYKRILMTIQRNTSRRGISWKKSSSAAETGLKEKYVLKVQRIQYCL